MKKITPAQANLITKDWNRQFPSLGVYKVLHLMRRCGPLLVGICLDRTSSGDVYKPTFHCHCLLRPFPVVSLSLPMRMRSANGADAAVSVKHHESKVVEAAERMKALALLPLDGDIELSQFDAACFTWLRLQQTPYWPTVYEDRVLMHSWLDQDFERPLHEAETALNTWPGFVLAKIGGVSRWIERIKSLAADRQLLAVTLDSEVEKLAVSGLPSGRLLP